VVSGSTGPGRTAPPRRSGEGDLAILPDRAGQPGQIARRDAGGGLDLPRRGRPELAEQRRHGGALVGEDADVALASAEGDRLGQRGQPAQLIAGGGAGQRLHHSYLD
jgi:hypothetical protein